MKDDRRVGGRAVLAAIVSAVLAVGSMTAASASTDGADAPPASAHELHGRHQGLPFMGGSLTGAPGVGSGQDLPADEPVITAPLSGSIQDGSAQPLVGAEVFAYRATGVPESPYTLAATVTTGSAGEYAFDALPVGEYDLLVSPTDADDAWGWLNGGPSPSAVPPVQVVEGQANTGPEWIVGASFPIGGSVTGGLSGKALDGVIVTLWGSSGTVSADWFYAVDEVTTSGGGSYAFAQVPPGFYLLQYTSPTSTYKGEWWKNKAGFDTANVIDTSGRASYTADTNLQQRVNLGEVTVTGASATGAVLTAHHHTVAGTTYRYTWLANGVAIRGATARTFAPTPAQAGRYVTVQVKGMRTGAISTTKSSEPRAKVLLTAVPKITGKTAIEHTYLPREADWDGGKLTAWPGKWTSGTTFRYQWYVEGKAISGATRSTYTVKVSDKDKRISVKVTGSKEGYGTFTQTSALSQRIALLGMVSIPSNPHAYPSPRNPLQGILSSMPSGVFTPGATFTYYFYADGVLVKAGSQGGIDIRGPRFLGQRITLKTLVSKPGYATHALWSEPTDPVVP